MHVVHVVIGDRAATGRYFLHTVSGAGRWDWGSIQQCRVIRYCGQFSVPPSRGKKSSSRTVVRHTVYTDASRDWNYAEAICRR